VNPFLKQLIEIDQDVSAQDDIKFIEGTIGRWVMLGKNDVFFLRNEGKIALSSGSILGRRAFEIMLRIVLHQSYWENPPWLFSGPSHSYHRRSAVVKPFLEQDRQERLPLNILHARSEYRDRFAMAIQLCF